MVTPFSSDGSVDFDVAAQVARYLVEQGSDGLVVAGSTGEGSSLSDQEKLDLFSCVAQAVNVPVLAGTSSSDTARSVALTSQVAATGVAGVLATTPAYARPNQSGIAAHLGAMAQSTPLGLMIYDIPSRTGRKVASATMIDLVRKHVNVIALKDASADLVSAAHTKAVLGDELDLYSGDDALLMPFMAIGAAGIVRSVQRGDWEQARALNERVAPSCAFESTEQYPNPMPSKAAMRALGFAVGQCRLPHGPSDVALDLAAADVIALLRGARG